MRALCEVRPDLEVPDGTGWALVLDADRTLAEIDTGRTVGQTFELNDRIRAMFASTGYTPDAFASHARIWSEVSTGLYEGAIEAAASNIAIHDVWRRVLGRADCPIIVVTAGIPQIWRSTLGHLSLARPVLGGLHAELDPYFVTPDCKAWVVRELQARGYDVVAAGDSEIDLPMLQAADIPLWVPDAKGSPRLRDRLGEVPGIRQVAIDDRRFPGLETVDAQDILTILKGATH